MTSSPGLAVHDARAVRRRERFGDLRSDFQRLTQRQRAFAKALRERFPRDVLYDEIQGRLFSPTSNSVQM